MIKKLVERLSRPTTGGLVSSAEVEAGAKAWLKWQFPNGDWDSASESMRRKFMDGARQVLVAAALARVTLKL